MKKKAVIVLAFLSLFFWDVQLAGASKLELSDAKVFRELTESVKNKLKRGAAFVFGIESKLEQSKDELSLLRRNIRGLEQKIDDSKIRAQSLNSQLEGLRQFISVNEEKMRAATLLAAETKNAIKILESEKKQFEKTLNGDLGAFNEILTAYYVQSNVLAVSQDSLLPLLSAENTNDILGADSNFWFLHNAGNEMLLNILEQQKRINVRNEELESKQKTLNELQKLLEKQKRLLADTEQGKKRLIEETQGRQLIYETLLSLSRQEFEQVNVQIAQLKENYEFFRQKVEALKDQTGLTIDPSEFSDEESEGGDWWISGKNRLAWPVSPSLGISAHFHDENYRATMGVSHNAIDIRLLQGSKVRTAAAGVVTKSIDNGFGYSYVIIAHAGKLITLYGHLSEIFVEEGEIVKSGQVIGLSGGIPGTKGAGWLTTGAHLHFEVFENFEHADPLLYLPLEFIPVSSIPEKYLELLDAR